MSIPILDHLKKESKMEKSTLEPKSPWGIFYSLLHLEAQRIRVLINKTGDVETLASDTSPVESKSEQSDQQRHDTTLAALEQNGEIEP